MTLYMPAWERRLLTWAREAAESETAELPMTATAEQFERAYQHCSELTYQHSRTFHLASGLLPRDKRRAARALYAFCRVSDDLVDRAGGDAEAGLRAWRERALSLHPDPLDRVALAWADARARYSIPLRYAEQLIEGVARDFTVTRYETFDELATYCYGVASTVGLMAMHIIGFAGKKNTLRVSETLRVCSQEVSQDAIPYAVKLGIALQLTNILRDVGEDWRAGRLYLPQEELRRYGLSESDIAAGHIDDRWRAFMRFQIERNRRLYAEALPGVRLLDPDGRFAIAAAGELYRAILEDIEAHDGDVFRRRAHIGTAGKLRRLPGIWRRSR